MSLVLVFIATFAAADNPSDPPGVSTFIEDPSGRAMLPFHDSLRRTEAGIRKTRVLFFGASHTAADLLTGRIRDNLQARFGDGGHGFFMPARPWKSYRKQHMSFDGPRKESLRWKWEFVRSRDPARPDGLYGLAGMAVTASEDTQWSRFRTAESGDFGTVVSRLELWYDREPDAGDLLLTISGERGKKRVRTGGPTGLGIYETTFRETQRTFEIAPKGNGPVRLYGGVLERDGQGVVLDNIGINGAKGTTQLKWDADVWTRLVRRRDPALIVLAYGTNESADPLLVAEDYEVELNAVLERVTRAAPRASCLLIGPTDHPVSLDPDRVRKDPEASKAFKHRARTDLVIAAQRRVAAKWGCGFYDFTLATGGKFSIVSWVDARPQLAWSDYVHFTADGYATLGDRITAALLQGYER